MIFYVRVNVFNDYWFPGEFFICSHYFNQSKNIWNKFAKSSKVGLFVESSMAIFLQFFSAFAKFSFLEERLVSALYFEIFLKFPDFLGYLV